MKYGVPTDDGKTVSKVFGRATSFAVYDDESSTLSILANEGANSEHGAGTGAAAFLAEKGVGIVAAPEFGPKAADALKTAGMRMEKAGAGLDLKTVLDGIVAVSKR